MAHESPAHPTPPRYCSVALVICTFHMLIGFTPCPAGATLGIFPQSNATVTTVALNPYFIINATHTTNKQYC